MRIYLLKFVPLATNRKTIAEKNEIHSYFLKFTKFNFAYPLTIKMCPNWLYLVILCVTFCLTRWEGGEQKNYVGTLLSVPLLISTVPAVMHTNVLKVYVTTSLRLIEMNITGTLPNQMNCLSFSQILTPRHVLIERS